MKTNGNDKALESYKIFPFVAWGLTLGFALFVYNITIELKAITEELSEKTDRLEMQVNTPVGEIKNFDTI